MARSKKGLEKAGAEMDKFFSESSASLAESQKDVAEEKDSQESVNDLNTAQKSTKKNTKGKKEESKEEPQKAQKKVFSFRAEVDQVDSWRVWADAKGMKVDELGEKALTEYIRRHGLTADQKQIYELKMAQKK